jgi:hypothetical protein
VRTLHGGVCRDKLASRTMANQLELQQEEIDLIWGRIGPDDTCDLMRL